MRFHLARTSPSSRSPLQTQLRYESRSIVFGRLTSTASWGLSAIQSLTVGDALEGMSEEERKRFRNLPSRILYGINSDMAIDLRLLGVPRSAAQPLADFLKSRKVDGGLGKMRLPLNSFSTEDWRAAVGNAGLTFERAWRVLEGLA